MRVAVLMLVLLPGCFNSQPHQDAPVQPITVQVPAPITAPDGRIDGLNKSVSDLRSEVQASSNTNQNSITGLGANISKVAEKVQGFGGDLARIETSFSAKLENTLNAQIEFKTQIRSEIRSEIQSQVQVNSRAEADLRARLDAMAQAQVGLQNSLTQFTQTVKSGRDSIVEVTQFSDNMAKVQERSYSTLYWTVMGMSGAMVSIVSILGYRSRVRAEDRFGQLQDHFIFKKGGSDAHPKS